MASADWFGLTTELRTWVKVAWQDQVRIIAEATGTIAEGTEVVHCTEKLLADTAKGNPEFAGNPVFKALPAVRTGHVLASRSLASSARTSSEPARLDARRKMVPPR